MRAGSMWKSIPALDNKAARAALFAANTKAGLAAARRSDKSGGMGKVPAHLRPVPANKVVPDHKIARLIARLDSMDASDRGEYIRDKADEWGMKESGLRSRVQRARS